MTNTIIEDLVHMVKKKKTDVQCASEETATFLRVGYG